MKEIVLKYLDDNYTMSLSTYVSYKLKDKYSGEDVSMKIIFEQLETIFSLTKEEKCNIFDSWADKKSIEMNNLIVAYQEKIYQLTGKTLKVSPEEMNGLINNSKRADELISMLINNDE